MTAPSTIFALASAAGRAGVAVVRISGPDAGLALTRLCDPATLPQPRLASLRTLRDPANGELVDRALVLWFPAPHSFTGEDVVELQLHGGRAVLSATFQLLGSLPGFCPAEPGAFSRRAFENGKMDLTEAEAIADLVDAETACQRRQALRQMDGALAQLYTGWADRLKMCLAHTEALIDFVDEEDIPLDLWQKSTNEVRVLHAEIASHLNDNRRGERLREGFTVAILGAPNAGKSSIMNALAQREVAIVTPTPGTTRDVIEVQLDLGGYPVTLADTAGLRETACAIESEGIRRALHRAEQADLKLLVHDGSLWPACDPQTVTLEDEESLVLLNKADRMTPAQREAMATHTTGKSAPFLLVSAQSGEGLSALIAAMTGFIDENFAASETPALTRARHRAALNECLASLDRALSAPEPPLVVEDIRLAMRALGRITGQVDVEDLLDVIFGSFCIGK